MSAISVLSDNGLLNALESDGPFTLLAPTNEAFQRLDVVDRCFVEDTFKVGNEGKGVAVTV